MSPNLPRTNTEPNKHPDSPPSTQWFASERFRHNAFLIACVLAAAIKIWLTLAFGMRAAGNALADDRLFVALAEHILNGNWLGPYDRHTLVKGPFFSIWIAGVFLAHIPLLLSYQLLHLSACALMLTALKPVMQSRPIRFALFVLLVFDPSTYSAMASWVIREGIYISLTMIVLACIIALLIRLKSNPRQLIAWSIGLGLALAALWTTREEGIWIVPAAAIAFAYAMAVIWKDRQSAALKTTLLILPAVICAAGVLGLCALNQSHYGVFQLVDMKAKQFERANGALMRVEHAQWNQYANVPKEVREKIYTVSPAFTELKDFLDGPPGEAWGTGAEVWLTSGTPSPTDIRGGFFVFALRQAVEGRGYYAGAQVAEAYYKRVADEINAACEDGRLDCGRQRASLTPPWRNEYIPLLLESFTKGLRMIVTYDDVAVINMPSAGPENMMTIFEDLGRARINPIMGEPVEPPRLTNQARLDEFRFEIMKRLNAFYKAVALPVTIIAGAAFLIGCGLELRARSISPTLIFMIAILASFLARLAILSMISITSFEAMKLRYFLPLYPMLLLFWFLAIAHVIRLADPILLRRNT